MTLNQAVKILSDAGISSALYDARELFRHFAHSDEGELVLRTANSDCPALIDAVMRRARYSTIFCGWIVTPSFP